MTIFLIIVVNIKYHLHNNWTHLPIGKRTAGTTVGISSMTEIRYIIGNSISHFNNLVYLLTAQLWHEPVHATNPQHLANDPAAWRDPSLKKHNN